MKHYFVIGLLLFGMYFLTAQNIQMPPCDDMYTDCSAAVHLEGDLFLNCEAPAEEEQILIKFDFSGMQGIQIDTASLNLHRYFSCGGGGGTTTAMIYLVNEDWNEDDWDPHTFVQYDVNSGFAYAFSGPAGTQNTWFEVDITDFVNLWLYGNQPNYGLVIIADPGQRHSKFQSKEAADPDYHPYLSVSLPVTAEDVISNPIISLSNYPNPFNPSTTIQYSLSEETDTALIVYNLKGRKIKTLTDGNQSAGGHSVIWDGFDDSGLPCTSGIYFVKIYTESCNGKYTSTRKLILLK